MSQKYCSQNKRGTKLMRNAHAADQTCRIAKRLCVSSANITIKIREVKFVITIDNFYFTSIFPFSEAASRVLPRLCQQLIPSGHFLRFHSAFYIKIRAFPRKLLAEGVAGATRRFTCNSSTRKTTRDDASFVVAHRRSVLSLFLLEDVA